MPGKTFADAFKSNMAQLGLPVPDSLYGDLGTVLATVGALAGAITKVGPTATVGEIFLTIPAGAGAAATATAIAEVVAVCGAFAASFYVGACVGSVIMAAYDTLSASDLARVLSWLGDIAAKLRRPVPNFLEDSICAYPKLVTVQRAVVLSTKADSAIA